MGKTARRLNRNVVALGIERMEKVFAEGHRVIVSFSGGKDSTCAMEVTLAAAAKCGKLPVDVVMRDEEVGWPGHYEYVERVAQRPEVNLRWVVARQAHSLIYDRECPFWWAFDDRLEPDQWVRKYPPYAKEIQDITIAAINSPKIYPSPEGKHLVNVIGIRAAESRMRRFGVFSMGGHLTGVKKGVQGCWPVYDWTDKDVWRAIKEFGWDYAGGKGLGYDGLVSVGVKGGNLRMGAMINRYGIMSIKPVIRLWPEWYAKMCERFPPLPTVLRIGSSAYQPQRRKGETWKQCYFRECVEEAPKWIAERSLKVAEVAERAHDKHAAYPIDDETDCKKCGPGRQSWWALAFGMWGGDPYSENTASCLPYVEPEFFRPELKGTPAGRWGGHPG